MATPGTAPVPAPDNETTAGQAGPARHFGNVLRELRQQRGISQAAVATRAGVDRSYINRLEAGERGAPAPTTVEAFATALALSPTETDTLLAAAGLLPRSLQALGPTDPTILLLAQRLTDPRLSLGARATLRITIETVLRHWGEPIDAR